MFMIARVLVPITAATAFAESHGRSSPSMSAKTGVAPVYRTAFAVATNVRDGTMASSPGPRPAARQIRWSAAVPLATAIAWVEPKYSANRFSSSSVRGPMLSQPERYVSDTAAISASPISTSARGTRQSDIREDLRVSLDLGCRALVLPDRPDVEPDAGSRIDCDLAPGL